MNDLIERNFFGTIAPVKKRPGLFRVLIPHTPGGAYGHGSSDSMTFEFAESDDPRVTADMEPIKFT